MQIITIEDKKLAFISGSNSSCFFAALIEISSGKEEEGDFKSIDSNQESTCLTEIDHGQGTVHEKEDKILDLVKMNTKPDAEECLVTE